MYMPQRKATVVIGGWFGDEGKGKIISYVAVHDRFKHVARAGVGTNAGHTVCINGMSYGLQMIPSGFTNPDAKLYIGKGVLVDAEKLLNEIKECGVGTRLYVDRLCPIIEQRHKDADSLPHYKDSVGSTGTGCGPAQKERVFRSRDMKFAKDVEELHPYLADVSELLNSAISSGSNVLVEMTQGTMLSLYGFEINGELTFHNATSKDTTAGTACADVGIGPTAVGVVIAVYKAIPSRVGQGIFPGELPIKEQVRLRSEGKGEFGTVTGRPRRLGNWTDEVFEWAKKAADINGATQIAVTKIDLAYPGNSGVREYLDLTIGAKDFIEKLEHKLQRPVTLAGTGQDVKDIIDMRYDMVHD